MRSSYRSNTRTQQPLRSLCHLTSRSVIAVILIAATISPSAFALPSHSTPQSNTASGALTARSRGQSQFLCQAPTEDESKRTTNKTPGDGASTPGSTMSERIRKYMGPAEGDEAGGSEMRRRFRERFRQLPEDQKTEIIQRFKNRSMGGGGPESMDGGGDGPAPDRGDAEAGPGGPGKRFQKGVRNYSYRRGGEMGPGGQLFGRRPLDFTILNLTDKQKEKIKDMREANSSKGKQLQGQLRLRRREIMDLLFAPQATKDQIMQKRDQVRALQQQAEDIMLNDFISIRSVLTEEQLQRLPELRPGRHRTPPPPGPSKQLSEKNEI